MFGIVKLDTEQINFDGQISMKKFANKYFP